MSKIDEIRQAAEQGIYIGILNDIEYLLKIAECADKHSYACIKLYSSNPDDLDFNNAEQTLFDLRKAIEGGEND